VLEQEPGGEHVVWSGPLPGAEAGGYEPLVDQVDDSRRGRLDAGGDGAAAPAAPSPIRAGDHVCSSRLSAPGCSSPVALAGRGNELGRHCHM
jgi:hypothetical protein